MVCAVEYSVEKMGVRLRRLREKNGMTQMQLAQASGIRQTTISGLELGKQQPRDSTLRLLALGLGISVDDLEAYLEGRKRLRVTHVVGDKPDPDSWIERQPELFGQAIAAVIARGEDMARDLVKLVRESESPQARTPHTAEGHQASPGRRSRRGA